MKLTKKWVLSTLVPGIAALVALGLLRWAATKENLFRCVGETVLIGGTCAAVAFAVGWVIGG